MANLNIATKKVKFLGKTGTLFQVCTGKIVVAVYETLAEAEEDILRKFLEKLSKAFAQYIQDVEVEWGAPSENFNGFGVEF